MIWRVQGDPETWVSQRSSDPPGAHDEYSLPANTTNFGPLAADYQTGTVVWIDSLKNRAEGRIRTAPVSQLSAVRLLTYALSAHVSRGSVHYFLYDVDKEKNITYTLI